MDEIKGHYATDEYFNFSFESLSKEAKTAEEIGKFKSFEVKDNILYYNGRVCVPKFGEHRLNIMNNLDDIPIAGHSGFQKTYMAVKHHYYWRGMKKISKNMLRVVSNVKSLNQNSKKLWVGTTPRCA